MTPEHTRSWCSFSLPAGGKDVDDALIEQVSELSGIFNSGAPEQVKADGNIFQDGNGVLVELHREDMLSVNHLHGKAAIAAIGFFVGHNRTSIEQ